MNRMSSNVATPPLLEVDELDLFRDGTLDTSQVTTMEQSDQCGEIVGDKLLLETTESSSQNGLDAGDLSSQDSLIDLCLNSEWTAALSKLKKFKTGTEEMNLLTDNGLTPLMVCIKENKISLVKMLIKLGAEVNRANQQGQTALHYAVNHSKEDVIKLLLDAGADPHVKDKVSGQLPLHVACKKGVSKFGMVQALLKRCDPGCRMMADMDLINIPIIMKLLLGVVCLCLALFSQSNATDSVEKEKIEALLMAYHDPKISENTKAMLRNKLIELGHVFAHDRTKRQAGDGSQFCCKIVDPREPLLFPRTRLAQETEVRTETRESCNEMRVCQLVSTNVTIVVFRTFQDFSEGKLVPQGDEPCPENFITCCNGFIFFSPVDNCVNFPDFRELVDIFTRFPSITELLNPTVVVATANAGPTGLE